jgi:hypothetical protein
MDHTLKGRNPLLESTDGIFFQSSDRFRDIIAEGWWAVSDTFLPWSKESALTLTPPPHELWPSFVFVVFWLLWLNRNELKHNGEAFPRIWFRNKLFLELERTANRQSRLGRRNLAEWWEVFMERKGDLILLPTSRKNGSIWGLTSFGFSL